jgi:endonuclease/exonuclease/phosphatase (EEP) superfamily protein YafD
MNISRFRPAIPRKLARHMAWGLAAGSLVHPLATSLAHFDWRADLIAHFREPALAASLMAAASMTVIHRPIAIGLGLLAIWQGWGLGLCSWPNPVPPDPRSSDRLRILMANVLVDNPEREGLIRLAREERPDVLGLIEVSRDWIAGLESIRSEFPHRFEYPSDDDGQGMALWLRQAPISVERFAPLTPGGNPALHAVIDFAGKRRDFWLIHFVSPLQRPDELPLGGEFVALADLVRRQGGSTLVVGDFNSTDGSPSFGRFLGASRLRDSRLGFGRQGSWPTWSPYRIGIDHAFLSADLAVVGRRLGPKIGSDHLPMILEVAPAAIADTKEPTHSSRSSKR